MSAEGSVTHWIGQLKAGNDTAAQKLWESYFHRLVRFARKRLEGQPRRAADEEDVALSAFDSFCRGTAQGRFPQLGDRDNLWQLLLTITERKVIDLMQRERRRKRGGGAVRGESALLETHRSCVEETGMARILSQEPTPEFAAQVADECRRLLAKLGDDQLRAVALWRMEGYSTEEIAAKLGCVPRTVERKLRAIRTLWRQEVAR
jgi:RNA polymerase sigma factor (sigma-70 family)